MPLEMKVLAPLRTYASPSRLAVVLIACRSEPAPGSVIAMAVMSSPEQKPGSQRAFCWSVVRSIRYGALMSLWMPNPTPLAPTRVNSSASTVL